MKSVDLPYWDFSHPQQGHVFDLNNQIKQNPAEMIEQSWTVWKCEHSKMSESSKCQPTSTLSLAALRFLVERIAIDSLLILVKCHTQEALSGTQHRAALVCACFFNVSGPSWLIQQFRGDSCQSVGVKGAWKDCNCFKTRTETKTMHWYGLSVCDAEQTPKEHRSTKSLFNDSSYDSDRSEDWT